MTTPITKADIESTLNITFSSDYDDDYFTELANYAIAQLEIATNGRTTYTGNAQYTAKKAMICIAIDWIASYDRDLLKNAITSISENGASISFSNGKTLESYDRMFKLLAAQLALPYTQEYTITQVDSGTDGMVDGYGYSTYY
jgi:hypothetical protein